MEQITYTATLREKTKLTPDIIGLLFTRPRDFSFLAGQFIQCTIPLEDGSLFRSFSIASTPADSHIELCVKIVPNGIASNFFSQMQIGEELSFVGPHGRFIAHHGETAASFIATGAGIAPILGILKDEIEIKKTERELHLLFGVQSEEDLFWIERLEYLKTISSGFHFELTISQPKPTGGWTGLKGRVTEHLLHHLVSHDYYLCGNASMVKDVRNVLLQNGISPTRIYFEIF